MANFASMTLLRNRRLSAHYSVFRYALRCAVPLALPRLWWLRLFHCTGRDLSNRLWIRGAWLELNGTSAWSASKRIENDRNIIQKDQKAGVSDTNFKADRLISARLPAPSPKIRLSMCANSWVTKGERCFFLTARCWCWRRFYNPQKSNSRWDSRGKDTGDVHRIEHPRPVKDLWRAMIQADSLILYILYISACAAFAQRVSWFPVPIRGSKARRNSPGAPIQKMGRQGFESFVKPTTGGLDDFDDPLLFSYHIPSLLYATSAIWEVSQD